MRAKSSKQRCPALFRIGYVGSNINAEDFLGLTCHFVGFRPF